MSTSTTRSVLLVTALTASLAGCAAEDPEEQVLLDVKAYTDEELTLLISAVDRLAAAAPAPDADGWNATDDAEAVSTMRTEWRAARRSYERIEGAIAVLFPGVDRATDERYDGFIEFDGDPNLFDGNGVTGMHAVERILFADTHPADVIAFESALPNYTPAAFPATEVEARDFEEGLVGRLRDDIAGMRDDFAPLALDPAAAFRGVIGSMAEQFEKVNLAATGEDESRYSQHTLADMRANLEGGREVYELFRPWLLAETGGPAADSAVLAGFDRIAAHYDGLPGDAVPQVPATWNASSPSAGDLATPYGELFTLLTRETDPADTSSLVASMGRAADVLGIPRLR